MSIETVRNKCIANHPNGDASGLDASITETMERFERTVKTAFNQSQKGGLFQYTEDPTASKNRFFQKNKAEYIRDHIGMLIDLYDYKPDA